MSWGLFWTVLAAYVAGRFACRLANSVASAALKTAMERKPGWRAWARARFEEDEALKADLEPWRHS